MREDMSEDFFDDHNNRSINNHDNDASNYNRTDSITSTPMTNCHPSLLSQVGTYNDTFDAAVPYQWMVVNWKINGTSTINMKSYKYKYLQHTTSTSRDNRIIQLVYTMSTTVVVTTVGWIYRIYLSIIGLLEEKNICTI